MNDPKARQEALEAGPERSAARSAVVNRTHRVVREQAVRMQEQRNKSRSLMAPLFISSALLLVVCYAVWGVMAEYDLTPSAVPDASDQVVLFLLWSLPVTAVVLGLVWLQRHRSRGSSGEQVL